jgi:hypothetical protein
MTDLAHRPWDGWRIARWTVAAILLLVPALAMQIPDSGWNWGVRDFVFAGVMIVGTCLLYEAAVTRSGRWTCRAGALAALAAAFLLVWINLAVAAGAHELVDRLDHVHRDADGARLVGDAAGDRLADPPGVGLRAGRQRSDGGLDLGAVVGLVVLVTRLVVGVDRAGVDDLHQAAARVVGVGDGFGGLGG